MTYRATATDSRNPVNEYTASPAPSPSLALETLRSELGIEAHGFSARMLQEAVDDLRAYQDVFGGLSLSIEAVN